MKRYAIFTLAAVALAAAAFVTDASARSGGHGMGNHGAGSHGSINAMRQSKVDRPTLNFSKVKLLKCHTYQRGNGMGGVNPVSVCF